MVVHSGIHERVRAAMAAVDAQVGAGLLRPSEAVDRLRTLAEEVAEQESKVKDRWTIAPDPEEAIQGLKDLVFLVSKIENYSRGCGRAAGEALREAPLLRRTLLAFADAAGHPPGPSPYLWGGEEPRLRFTSDPREETLMALVRHADARLGEVAEALEPVCSGIAAQPGEACLKSVRRAVESVRSAVRSARRAVEEASPSLAAFAAGPLQAFFEPVVIDGTRRSHPGLGITANLLALDHLVGVDDPPSRAARAVGSAFLPGPQRTRLASLLTLQPLPLMLVVALGVSDREAEEVTAPALLRRLGGRAETWLSVVAAYADLVGATREWHLAWREATELPRRRGRPERVVVPRIVSHLLAVARAFRTPHASLAS